MTTVTKINKVIAGLVVTFLMLLSYFGSIGCNGNGETTPASFNKNFRLIFPQTTNVPVINGLLSDTAWDDSFELGLEEGSTLSQAKVHGVADANDPGCHTDGDVGNPDSYDPNDEDEFDLVPYAPYCGDSELNQE